MMSFTRAQREELNALCLKIFGSSGTWQKILKRKVSDYQIPCGQKKDPSGQVYFKINKEGTAVTETTARNLGVLPEDYNPTDHANRSVTVYRDPDFEELKWMLNRNWDQQLLGVLMNQDIQVFEALFALRLVQERLQYPLLLRKADKTEEYSTECDNLLAALPEELSNLLKEVIVDSDEYNSQQVFMDAKKFLELCVMFRGLDEDHIKAYEKLYDHRLFQIEKEILNARLKRA